MFIRRIAPPLMVGLSLVSLVGTLAPATHAQTSSTQTAPPVLNPTVNIAVDRAILVFATPTTTVATLAGQVLNFRPTSYQWQQLQEYMSPYATKGTATFTSPNTINTKAYFSAPGVYELALTVSDGKNTIVRHVWVNVWPSQPALKRPDGTPDPLTTIPGTTPPPGVRNLSADPGPFSHPRVFCTNRDWSEISQRNINGKIASAGVSRMQNTLNGSSGIYNANAPFGKLYKALATYASNNFTGDVPDLTLGNSNNAASHIANFETQLKYAAYLLWISQNPSVAPAKVDPAKQAQFKQLASVVAAYSRLLLGRIWDRNTNTFNKTDPLYIGGLDNFGGTPSLGTGGIGSEIGVAYDFIATWMTPAQQRDTRDLLFATSYGRTTGSRVPGGNHYQGGLMRGHEQNGDFANMNEYVVFNQMAISGEESGVSADVYATFTNFPAGSGFKTINSAGATVRAGDWARPWNQASPWQKDYYRYGAPRPDYGPAGVTLPAEVDPYPEAVGWPNALKVDIDNLWRQFLWTDTNVSPWGFSINREAYFGLSAMYYWPAALSYAIHGGENQFVSGNFYNSMLLLLHESYMGQGTTFASGQPSLDSNIYLFDHEDSGGYDYRLTHILLLKYMYPNDYAVDYLYAANAPSFPFDPFQTALFGLDPGFKGQETTLPQVATTKRLPLIKLDPQSGVAVARSGWKEDDASFYFASSWIDSGHLHAEKNNFSFFALGRAWSIAPGYHVTINDAQSSVLVQHPDLTDDPATAGFIGESPSSAAFDHPDVLSRGRPVSGRLLEVTEDPKHNFAIIAADATDAYGYGYGGGGSYPLAPWYTYMYPGLYDHLTERHPYNGPKFAANLKATSIFNPVQYALRTALFVRGARPYVLIVDDINKDGNPQNYRWTMNCAVGFGSSRAFIGSNGREVFSTLTIQPGSTATEATLYHAPIDVETVAGQTGLPRLLVRDVSPLDNSNQPPIFLEKKSTATTPQAEMLTYGVDNNHPDNGRSIVPTARVLIERDAVVTPQYKVLLFPYKTGEALPITRWTPGKNELKIDLKNGWVDTITFTPNADQRTRVSWSRGRK